MPERTPGSDRRPLIQPAGPEGRRTPSSRRYPPAPPGSYPPAPPPPPSAYPSAPPGSYPPAAPGSHPGGYPTGSGTARHGPGSTQRTWGDPRTPHVTPQVPGRSFQQEADSGRHEWDTQVGGSGPFSRSGSLSGDTLKDLMAHSPASASSTWRSGRRFGRYMLIGELGRGGFGTVFLAHDPHLDRDVAVKILTKGGPRALARFERETKAYARLRHPGIVSIHDSGTVEGRPFLVMEYVSGDTLEAMGGSDRRLTVSRTVELVRETAHALHYAHAQGILHRDVKPANILVDQDGHARVLDFGLAFLKTDEERLSRTGVPLGTPAYMAPEQFKGEQADARADVYALGGTLYYCLTGESPLDRAEGFFEAMRRADAPSPRKINPEVPAELDAICQRALAKDPDDRYQSAEELAEELSRFLAGPRSARSSANLQAVGIVAGLAAVLIGATFLALSALGEDEPVPPDASTAALPPPPPATQPDEARQLLEKARGALKPPEDVVRARQLLDQAAALATGEPKLLSEIQREQSMLRARQALAQAQEQARMRAGHATVLSRFDRARELAKDAPPLFRQEIELARAWHLFNRTYYEDAAKLAATLTELSGRQRLDARFLEAMATVLQRGDARPRGLELLLKLAQDDPGGVIGDLATACEASQRVDSDYARCERYARKVLSREPDHPVAAIQLGVTLTNTNRRSEALQVLTRLGEETVPDMARAHLGIALNTYQGRGKLPEALSRIDLAMRLVAPKDDALALQVRAQIRLARGEFLAAERDLQQSLALGAGECSTWLLLGMTRDQQSDWKGAREAFRKSMQVDPQETAEILETFTPLPVRYRAKRLLGLPVVDQRLSTIQREALEGLVQGAPGAAREPLLEALELAVRGHAWESLASPLERAAQAVRDDAELTLLVTQVMLGRGRYGEARRVLARAQELAAPADRLYLVEGLIAWNAGERSRAVSRFEAAHAADPKGWAGSCGKALERLMRNDPAAGLEAAERALQDEPQGLIPLAVAAWGCLSAGQLAKARERAEAARERYGLLDPWVQSTYAALLLGELVSEGRQPSHERLSAPLLELERALGATSSATPRLTGLEHVWLIPKRDPWYGSAQRWLWEIEQTEPGRAEIPLFKGLFSLQAGAGRSVVLRYWQEALRRDPALPFPPALREIFERELGQPLDVDALRRGR